MWSLDRAWGWGGGVFTGTGGWGETRTRPQSALNTAEQLTPLLNGALRRFIKITAGPCLGFREFTVKDRAPTLTKKSSFELAILVLLPP